MLENHAEFGELPPGYKMTELGPLPEEWQVVRLEEVTKLTKGQKPPELLKTYSSGSLPYLTADYFRTRITKEWVPKEHLPHLPLCSPEDVVLIWDGSKAGQVFTGLEGVLASTMVRVDPEKELRRDYLFFFLTTQFDTLNTQTTGSTIPHVNKDLFRNLLVPLPPLPEQQTIAEILRAVDRKIEAEEARQRALEALFRTLLHNLMTARLRLPKELVARFAEDAP
jgi:type I restriction enzyme S subunit